MRVDFYEMSGRYTDPLFVAAILSGRAWPACGRLTIVGSADQLTDLDERLWHEPPGRFLPHVRIDAGDTGQAWTASSTAIVLTETAPETSDVLINLQPDGPLPDGHYTRVLEIVPPQEELRRHLRQRWTTWKQRGADLHHHRLK